MGEVQGHGNNDVGDPASGWVQAPFSSGRGVWILIAMALDLEKKTEEAVENLAGLNIPLHERKPVGDGAME